MRNAVLAIAVVCGLSLFAVPAFAGGPQHGRHHGGHGGHGGHVGHGGHGGHGRHHVVHRHSGYYVQPHVRSHHRHHHVVRPVPYCSPYVSPGYGYGGVGYGNSGYFGLQGPNFGFGVGW